jgi:hypothetical protein
MNETMRSAAAEYAAAQAAHESCESELARRAKMLEQVDADAAALPGKEALLQSKASEAADADAERSIASDDAVRTIDAKLKRVRGEEDAASRDLNQTRARLQALESKIETSDEAVRSAANVLSAEIGALEARLTSAISSELAAALRPVIAVLAKARAIGGPQMTLLASSAVVPDPAARIDITGQSTFCSNLLDAEPDEQQAGAADAIRQAMLPFRATLAKARGLPSYVPLSKRPPPYVRRGYTIGRDTSETRAANGTSPGAPAMPAPDGGQSRLTSDLAPHAGARGGSDRPHRDAPGVALERARTFEQSRGLQGSAELDSSEFVPRIASASSRGRSEFDPLA